jgi:hypothetical protein
MVEMSIRHMNYDFEELRKIVAKAIEQVPNIVATMNKMRDIEATEEQKVAMATEVVKIRKGVDTTEDIEIGQDVIEDILTPIRAEDNSNDLWTIFNICQEKMIKGGFSAPSRKSRSRKQRAITSIKKDMEYNQRLWQTASQYLAVA